MMSSSRRSRRTATWRAFVRSLLGATVLALAIACSETTQPVATPVVQLDRLPDTVHTRGLTITGMVSGAPVTVVELVLDPGSPNARVFHPDFGDGDIGPGPFTATIPDTLSNGRHLVVLRTTGRSAEQSVTTEDTLSFVVAVPEVSYLITALPSLGGAAEAHMITKDGTVSGVARDAMQRALPVLWRHGTLVQLAVPAGLAAGTSASRVVVNENGVAAASLFTGVAFIHRTVVWRGMDAAVIPPPSGPEGPSGDCCVADIDVAGTILLADSPNSALIRPDGTRVLVPGRTTPGAFRSLNNREQAVGEEALTYRLRPLPLGTTDGMYGRPQVTLVDVNDREQVLGYWGGGASSRSFLSQAGASAAIELAHSVGLIAATSSTGSIQSARAIALNDAGVALLFDEGAREGWLFTSTDSTIHRIRLRTPGWRLESLGGINDAGWIIGQATNTSTGDRTAVLLTPTA
jgi:hypothetical protein